MDFSAPVFGFNEPTLTTLTYICYVLACICYGVHLLTKSARAVAMPRGEMALAGAGGGRRGHG